MRRSTPGLESSSSQTIKNGSSSLCQSTSHILHSTSSKIAKDESPHCSSSTCSTSSTETVKFYPPIHDHELPSYNLEPISSVCVCNLKKEINEKISTLCQAYDEEISSGSSDNPFLSDQSSCLGSFLTGTLTISSTDDTDISSRQHGSHWNPFFRQWTTITATDLRQSGSKKYYSTYTSSDPTTSITSQTTITYDSSSAPCLPGYDSKKQCFRRNFLGRFNHLWAHYFLPEGTVSRETYTTDSAKTLVAKSASFFDPVAEAAAQNTRERGVKPLSTSLKSRTLTNRAADKSTSVEMEHLQKELEMLSDTHSPKIITDANGLECLGNTDLPRNPGSQKITGQSRDPEIPEDVNDPGNISDQEMLGDVKNQNILPKKSVELPTVSHSEVYSMVRNELTAKDKSCNLVENLCNVKKKSKLTWSVDVNSSFSKVSISTKISSKNTQSNKSALKSSVNNKNLKKSYSQSTTATSSKSKSRSGPSFYKALQPTFFPFSLPGPKRNLPKNSPKSNTHVNSSKKNTHKNCPKGNIHLSSPKRNTQKNSPTNPPNPSRKLWNIIPRYCKHCHVRKSKSSAFANKYSATHRNSKANFCNLNASKAPCDISPRPSNVKGTKCNSNLSPSSKFSSQNVAVLSTNQNPDLPLPEEQFSNCKNLAEVGKFEITTSSPTHLEESNLTSSFLDSPKSAVQTFSNQNPCLINKSLSAIPTISYSCLTKNVPKNFSGKPISSNPRRSKWFEDYPGSQKSMLNEVNMIDSIGNQFLERSSENSLEKRLFISKCNKTENISQNAAIKNNVNHGLPRKYSNAKKHDRRKTPRLVKAQHSLNHLSESEIIPTHLSFRFHTMPQRRLYQAKQNLSSLSIQSAPNLDAGRDSKDSVRLLSRAETAFLMSRKQSPLKNMSPPFHPTFNDTLIPPNYDQNYGFWPPIPFSLSAKNCSPLSEPQSINQNVYFSKFNHPFMNTFSSSPVFNQCTKEQSHREEVEAVNQKSSYTNASRFIKNKNPKSLLKEEKKKYFVKSAKMMELRFEKESSWFGRSLDSLWYIPRSPKKKKNTRGKAKHQWLH